MMHFLLLQKPAKYQQARSEAGLAARWGEICQAGFAQQLHDWAENFAMGIQYYSIM